VLIVTAKKKRRSVKQGYTDNQTAIIDSPATTSATTTDITITTATTAAVAGAGREVYSLVVDPSPTPPVSELVSSVLLVVLLYISVMVCRLHTI